MLVMNVVAAARVGHAKIAILAILSIRRDVPFEERCAGS